MRLNLTVASFGWFLELLKSGGGSAEVSLNALNPWRPWLLVTPSRLIEAGLLKRHTVLLAGSQPQS